MRVLRLLEMGALRGKLVVTFHGYDALVVPRESGPDVYSALFHSADALTVGSEFMRNRLLEIGAPANRTVAIPIGIDLDVFAPPERSGPHVASTRLLSVSRLIESKGIHVALHAVARLKEAGVHVTYTVMGDGPARDSLEALSRELGIVELVEFKGETQEEEVSKALQQADVFVHPAIHGEDGWVEGQGLVLAEAQAMCVPVVASRSGGIPESIADGVTGYLVPEGDPEAIAERVEFLVRHPREGITMGKAGRKLAETRFDLGSYLARLEDVYTGLLAS
jgi:colanic acid/amylovoran biosynthesis glycosyltransferase